MLNHIKVSQHLFSNCWIEERLKIGYRASRNTLVIHGKEYFNESYRE